MKKEFKFIEFVGAVLGFLIGVAQLFIIENQAAIENAFGSVLGSN